MDLTCTCEGFGRQFFAAPDRDLAEPDDLLVPGTPEEIVQGVVLDMTRMLAAFIVSSVNLFLMIK